MDAILYYATMSAEMSKEHDSRERVMHVKMHSLKVNNCLSSFRIPFGYGVCVWGRKTQRDVLTVWE